MTHICVSKLTIIGSDNGLSPDQCQAIIWNKAGILLSGPLGTNFSEILIKIIKFSFKKMHLKVSSAKWFSLGLNVLMAWYSCGTWHIWWTYVVIEKKQTWDSKLCKNLRPHNLIWELGQKCIPWQRSVKGPFKIDEGFMFKSCGKQGLNTYSFELHRETHPKAWSKSTHSKLWIYVSIFHECNVTLFCKIFFWVLNWVRWYTIKSLI